MPAVVDFRRLGDDFAAFVADPTSETSVAYAERIGLKVSHTRDIRGKRYHIVRYDKKKYASDDETPPSLRMTDEVSMLRSVIIFRLSSISLNSLLLRQYVFPCMAYADHPCSVSRMSVF